MPRLPSTTTAHDAIRVGWSKSPAERHDNDPPWDGFQTITHTYEATALTTMLPGL